MKGAFFAVLMMATPALPQTPQFADLGAAISEHHYSGGWEYFVGGGVAAFDCSDNGLPDLFLAGGEGPALLLRNMGGMEFAPQDTGLTGVTGAYPLDIDGDGVLDVFVLRVGPNVVLRGLGDCQFEDATEALGIDAGAGWSTAFSAWWDAGADRPSMFVGNYVDRDDPAGPFFACDDNQMLRAHRKGWTSAPFGPGFCPLSALAAPDARDRMTLRLSNDRHYYVRGGHEQMWDIEDGRFLGADDGWPELMLWGMGIASRDITGNGLADVYLTSMADQMLQLAQPDGTYRAAPFSMGHTAHRPFTGDDGRPSTGWHAQWGDVTNNGRVDLFVAKGNVDQMPDLAMADPNNLLLQGPDGTFTESAHLAGLADPARSRGAALVDLDGDGRLDLVVINRRAPARLYRNVTEGVGNWLAVDLRQDGTNRFAIGARVTVDTETASQWQDITIGGGHAGGQLVPLHFGLGDATGADVHVRWPDGEETRHRIGAVNQRVTLRRD
ncbi:CRTAC1 family protein [Roseinatronobacter sp. S2]|uniref:CRTAC1 family protein n=1 Tax=Roseinatronobacter sp. S2 TaxID=3035471 RepID=UPI002410A3AA|nr:CRTAC1 family protein [Roseinatronobacter sp. S2]WFE76851.1 CRTAC1 family protein [Roseinatronobacter sp. S2]